jgi:hypothetical protein
MAYDHRNSALALSFAYGVHAPFVDLALSHMAPPDFAKRLSRACLLATLVIPEHRVPAAIAATRDVLVQYAPLPGYERLVATAAVICDHLSLPSPRCDLRIHAIASVVLA